MRHEIHKAALAAGHNVTLPFMSAFSMANELKGLEGRMHKAEWVKKAVAVLQEPKLEAIAFNAHSQLQSVLAKAVNIGCSANHNLEISKDLLKYKKEPEREREPERKLKPKLKPKLKAKPLPLQRRR